MAGRMERFKYIVTDLKNRRVLRYFWAIATYFWRLVIPPLWVAAVFLASLPLWTWYTGRYLVNFYLALRLVPFLFLGYGVILLPFQESQVEVIETLDSFFDCIDQLANGIYIPTMNNVIQCIYPLCRIDTIFWDIIGFVMRYITTLLRVFIVDDLFGLLEAFLQLPPFNLSASQAADVSNAILDYLDIDVCNPDLPQTLTGCTGDFYDQWNDLDFDDLDLFWPPGPDKRTVNTPNAVMARRIGTRRYKRSSEDVIVDFLRDVPSDWISPPLEMRMSSYSSVDSPSISGFGALNLMQEFAQHPYRDFGTRNTNGSNDTCCFLPIDGNFTVFELFQDGPDDFSTVILGFVCAELDDLLQQILYLIIWIFDFFGQIFQGFENEFADFDFINNGPVQFIHIVANTFTTLLLNIPCLNWNGAEAFFTSLVTCTCEGITDGNPIPYLLFFNATSWEEIPGTALCCMGLCCVTSNTGELPLTFNGLFRNIVNCCLEDLTDNLETLSGIIDDICDDLMVPFCDDLPDFEYGPGPGCTGVKRAIYYDAGMSEEEIEARIASPPTASSFNEWTGDFFNFEERDTILENKAREIMRENTNMEEHPEWVQYGMYSALYYYLDTMEPSRLLRATGINKGMSDFLSYHENTSILRFFRLSYYRELARGVAERTYESVAGQTAVGHVFRMALRGIGSAVFHVADRKLSGVGIPRVIRKEHIDPVRDPVLVNPETGATRRMMKDHWLRRYARENNMDDEYLLENTNDTIALTDGQLSIRAWSVMVSDVFEIVGGITWSSDDFQFKVPSYNDVGAHLKMRRFAHTTFDFGRLFFAHVNEDVNTKYPRSTWSPPSTKGDVLFRTILYRLLAPELLTTVEQRLEGMGSNYREAAFEITRPFRQDYEDNIEKYTQLKLASERSSNSDETLRLDEDYEAYNRSRQEIRSMMSTFSAKVYLIGEYERERRRNTMMYQRKVSYEFQRKLARYYGEKLTMLDRNLHLPDHPEAMITPQVAKHYIIRDGHVLYIPTGTPWAIRQGKWLISSVFDKKPNEIKGVDPELVRIFSKMNDPTSTSLMYGANTRWGGDGILGWGSSLTKSPNPTEVFGRTMDEAYTHMVGNRDGSIEPRLPVMSALGVLFQLVLAIIKQWRWASVLFVPLVSSPEFQTSGRIALQPFFDFWADIYKQGLGPTFSEAGLANFAIETGVAQINAIFYAIISGIRFAECNLRSWVIQILNNLLLGILTFAAQPLMFLIYPINFLVYIISFTSPLWGNCPVDVQFSGGIPTRPPWNYIFDQIDADPTQSCTDETDCIAMNPCQCEQTSNYYLSYFYKLGSSQNCPLNSGKCLVWPRVACNFQFGTADFSAPFEKQCTEFGYSIKSIVWYQNPSFFGFLGATFTNLYRATQYVTRNISRGYRAYFSDSVMTLILLLLAAIFFSSRRYQLALFFVILLVAIVVGQTVITNTIENIIFPILEELDTVPIIGPFFGWLLSMLRWPNHSDSEPFGSPQAGEEVCFLANSPSMAVGVFIGTLILGTIFGLGSSGALYGILAAVLFFIVYPFRAIFGCIFLTAMAPNYPQDDNDTYNGLEPEGYLQVENPQQLVMEDGDPFLQPTLDPDDPHGYRILTEETPPEIRIVPSANESGYATQARRRRSGTTFYPYDKKELVPSLPRRKRGKRKKRRDRDVSRLIHPAIVHGMDALHDGFTETRRNISTAMNRGVSELFRSAAGNVMRRGAVGVQRVQNSMVFDSQSWNLPWEEDDKEEDDKKDQ